MPESSPDAEVEIPAVESQTDENATSTESSTEGTEGQNKGDMLSAVEAALKPKEGSPDSASPGSEGEKPEADEADGEEPEDLSDEEQARLSQKARRRFHKLAGEVATLTKQVDEFKPAAEQFQKVMSFASEAGLSVEDMNTGFSVMRNIKLAPEKAYEQLAPIMNQLEQMLGLGQLPADLQNAVSVGQITEAHARELNRARSAAKLNGERLDQFTQKSEQQRQTSAVKQQWDDAASATTEWENSKAKSDPDWKHKQSRVLELIELDLLKRQRQNPNFAPTTQEAVTMADEALKKVNEEFKRFAPKPKQLNPGAKNAGASPSALPKPNSMFEAVEQGLARMKAG
jgi:hypothetical protein